MTFLIIAAIIAVLAGSLWLTYVIVKFLLNRVKEPVFPLPPGVRAICSFQACHNIATIGLRGVVKALNSSGEYCYLSEDKPEVYCEKHRPSFGQRHTNIRMLIAVSVWVCLMWVFAKAG